MGVFIQFVKKSLHWALKERVYVLPYHTLNGKIIEILVRDEPDTVTNRVITVVGGGRDAKDGDTDKWHLNAAKRELFEETGYNVHESKLEEIGSKRFKSNEQCDFVYCVDVTDERAGKPITDGSEFEKKSKNKFVTVDEFKKLVENSSDQALLTAAIHFLFEHNMVKSKKIEDLNKTNVSNKPTQSDMGGNAKVGTRQPFTKYEERIEVMPGVYQYKYDKGGDGKPGVQPAKDQQQQMYEQVKQIMEQDPFASRLVKFFGPPDYNAIISILYAKGFEIDPVVVMEEVNTIKKMIGSKANEFMPSQVIATAFKDVLRKAYSNPEAYIEESKQYVKNETDSQMLLEQDSVFYRTSMKVPDEVIIKLKNDRDFLSKFKEAVDYTYSRIIAQDPSMKDLLIPSKQDEQV